MHYNVNSSKSDAGELLFMSSYKYHMHIRTIKRKFDIKYLTDTLSRELHVIFYNSTYAFCVVKFHA